MIKITCLGAAGSVTGSSYLVENEKGKQILIDCGLFQGGKQLEKRNLASWGFNPALLENLILTHAHIDHSGRIPKLVKDGFHGRIITSPPTAELCQVMLLDSAHVQEMDAEWQTRKNLRQGKKAVDPLYTMEDAEKSLQYFFPLERDHIFDLGGGMRVRLRNAGHILGSSVVELWLRDDSQDVKVVFSGDLGKHDQLIVKDPHEIFEADYVFIESTYGNRLHRAFEDSKAELLEAIHYAVDHGEKVVIPAFAMERTQEILYLLGEFSRAGSLPDIPIYLDSPLAIKATEIFRQNKEYYDAEARAIVEQGFDPFDMPNLHFTPTTRESIAINETPGSAIIIAASGMMNAGRIKHHLKHNLWRPGASIIIVGFQAEGTTGRKIVDGARTVKIFREDVAVRAKVYTIGGFSAHADRDGLMEWLGHFASSSHPDVFVTHGEETASEAMAQHIREQYKLTAYVPHWKETLVLKPLKGKEKVTPEVTVSAAPGDALELMIGDLEKEITRLRQELARKGKRAVVTDADVERLKNLHKELEEVLTD